jgi:ribosomal-protein-alanine N-acetyltransferase
LICTALTNLGDKGAIGVTLEVREGNKAAQELYRGFGFEFIRRRKGYYKDNGEDAIVMTLHRLDIDRFTSIACRQALSSVNGG